MKTLKTACAYYLFGLALSLFLIGLIHLHGYLTETHFYYAEWDHIITISSISGIPFGFAIYLFKKVKDNP